MLTSLNNISNKIDESLIAILCNVCNIPNTTAIRNAQWLNLEYQKLTFMDLNSKSLQATLFLPDDHVPFYKPQIVRKLTLLLNI